MNLLFTGGSSNLGFLVLNKISEHNAFTDIACFQRSERLQQTLNNVRLIRGDLVHLEDFELLPSSIDLVVNFAALTRTMNAAEYWRVNVEGLKNLVRAVRQRGCQHFFHISTQCASENSGAYGESKLESENVLLCHEWSSLTIVRLAEIYGFQKGEGLDRILEMAKSIHIVPMMFGSNIRFRPLHFEDAVNALYTQIVTMKKGVHILELSGPEVLNGVDVALRIGKKYRAVPVPVYLPVLRMFERVLGLVPDQLTRLIAKRTPDKPGSTELFKDNFKKFPV